MTPKQEQIWNDMLRQTRRNNILMGVLIGLVLLAGIGVMIASNYVLQLAVNETALSKQVTKRLAANADRIAAEAARIMAETGDPVAEAFYRQVEQDVDVYARTLENQSDELLEGLKQKLQAELKEEYKDYFRRHRAVIAEVFPKYGEKEDVERLIGEFDKVAARLRERYQINALEDQFERTAKLWEQVEPYEISEDKASEMLVEYLIDWTVLTAEEQLVPEGERTAKGGPAPAKQD